MRFSAIFILPSSIIFILLFLLLPQWLLQTMKRDLAPRTMRRQAWALHSSVSECLYRRYALPYIRYWNGVHGSDGLAISSEVSRCMEKAIEQCLMAFGCLAFVCRLSASICNGIAFLRLCSHFHILLCQSHAFSNLQVFRHTCHWNSGNQLFAFQTLLSVFQRSSVRYNIVLTSRARHDVITMTKNASEEAVESITPQADLNESRPAKKRYGLNPDLSEVKQ